MMNKMLGLPVLARSAAGMEQQNRLHKIAKKKGRRGGHTQLGLLTASPMKVMYAVITPTPFGIPCECNSSLACYFSPLTSLRPIPAWLPFDTPHFPIAQSLSMRSHNRNCRLSDFRSCKPAATPDDVQSSSG